MGLCLDLDCKPLIWSEQQWKQVTAWPSTTQVNATAGSDAFSLQASPRGRQRAVACADIFAIIGSTLTMKVRSEGARLEAADVEPCRLQQAPTVRVTTRGVGAGGLGATGPSAAAGRLDPSDHFPGMQTEKRKEFLNKPN